MAKGEITRNGDADTVRRRIELELAIERALDRLSSDVYSVATSPRVEAWDVRLERLVTARRSVRSDIKEALRVAFATGVGGGGVSGTCADATSTTAERVYPPSERDRPMMEAIARGVDAATSKTIVIDTVTGMEQALDDEIVRSDAAQVGREREFASAEDVLSGADDEREERD